MKSPSLLTELLTTLSIKERKSFDRYLENKYPKPVYLDKWKLLYQQFNLGRPLPVSLMQKGWKNLILEELKSFLINNWLNENRIERNKIFFLSIEDSEAVKNKLRSLRKMASNQKHDLKLGKRLLHSDSFYYLKKISFDIENRPRGKVYKPDYSGAESALELTFLIPRIRLLLLRWNSERILPENNTKQENELPSELSNLAQKHLGNPLVCLLIKWVEDFRNVNSETLIVLFNQFWSLESRLDSGLGIDIFGYLCNRLNRLINVGELQYVVVLNIHFQAGEMANLLVPGKIHPAFFKNFFLTWIRGSDLVNAEMLYNRYSNYLPTSYLLFAQAQLSFEKGDLRQGKSLIEYFFRLKSTDNFLTNSFRILEIQILAELFIIDDGDRGLLDSRIKAHLKYLQSNEVYFKSSFMTIKILSQVLKPSNINTLKRLEVELIYAQPKCDRSAWLARVIGKIESPRSN